MRGSPSPPGFRRDSSTVVKLGGSTTTIVIGQSHLDALLAQNILDLQTQVSEKTSLIGSLNSQVPQLQSQVAEKEATIAGLEAEADASGAQILQLGLDIIALNAEIGALNAQVLQAGADLDDALQTIAGLESGGGSPLGSGGILPSLNDPAWTYYGQYASVRSGYSFNETTGVHTISTIGISANADFTLGSGSQFLGPRWTMPLFYPDGSPVMIGDGFGFTVKIDNFTKDSTVAQMNYYLGTYEHPTDSMRNYLTSMRAAGIFGVVTATGIGIGGHAGNSQSSSISAPQFISGTGTVAFPPGREETLSTRPSWAGSWTSTSTGGALSSWQRQSAATGQRHLIFALSTNGANAAVAGTVSFRMTYSVSKL